MDNNVFKISIIIPMYNCENYICNTVNSILQFNNDDIEIIMVNDGSSDNTRNVVLEKYGNLSNVVVCDKNNGGVSSARNFGLEKARGEYITFIDSDDIYNFDWLRTVQHYLDGSDTDMIVYGYEIWNSLEKKMVKRLLSTHKNMSFDLLEYLRYLTIENRDILINVVWNKIYKKEIIMENKLKFDELLNQGEDCVFNINYLLKVKKIVYLDSSLYRYVKHSGSITTKFNDDFIYRRKTIYSNYIKITKIIGNEDICKLVQMIEGKALLNDLKKLNRDNTIKYSKKNALYTKIKKSNNFDCLLFFLNTVSGLKGYIIKKCIQSNYFFTSIILKMMRW